LNWAMDDWAKLEKMRHWLVPKRWGIKLARVYGYVGKYMASAEYKLAAQGTMLEAMGVKPELVN
jgi:hypothetical protein